MKVTPPNKTDLTAKRVEERPSGSGFGSSAIEGDAAGAFSEKSDFAQVLDKVTRSHSQSSHRDAEKNSISHSDKRDTRTGDKENLESDALVAVSERPFVREPGATAVTDVDTRAILHPIDLDNMITACHVQLAANGGHEVTLELSHSILEGLKVKVSADAAGRITADFLAANEGIKSLLDGRSSALLDQLRARGIDVAEFKTSVAADTGGRNESRREQQPARVRAAGAVESAAVAANADSEAGEANPEAPESGATYRA